MRYHPNYIIFKQTLRYLTYDQQLVLINKCFDIKSDSLEFAENLVLDNKLFEFKFNGRLFLKRLMKNFDISKFKDSPLVWQDIWLYNYITFDSKDRRTRNSLIEKYEKEIFEEDDEVFFRYKDDINKRELIPRHAEKKSGQIVKDSTLGCHLKDKEKK